VAHSDLDLVLLHNGLSTVDTLAQAIWYPVWDAGVGLDHSVRSLPEALSVARSDLKVALGLLDARHIAGDSALTASLVEQSRAAWRAEAGRRLPELHEAMRGRAERHGDVAFLLEPELKEGRGGLRDVHALHAVAAAQLADPPGPAVRSAYGVLLDVRGELHRAAGRRLDRLLLQEQPAVAAALHDLDADLLLRRVSAAARTIAYAADTTWRAVTAELNSRRRRLPRLRRTAEPVRRPLAEGVVEQDGEVVLARDADPGRDPVLVLRAAAAAAANGLPLAPHTLERLRASAAPLPEPWPEQARLELVSLLATGPAAVPVLEALDQAGLLVALLPDWERVRARPQRNPVHRFTVDRHLVETAAQAAALTRQVARPDLLLLAALLHDVGKGWPGDHTCAGVAVVGDLAPRLGLAPVDVATLVALVRHHLLLPETATRRDLDDPATVHAVAAAVEGSADLLDLLHALTVADALATGPAAWSEWKAGLVDTLVARVRAVLQGAALPQPAGLPEAGLRLAERGETAIDVAGTTVTVVAPDVPGLLSRAAGVLALHRLEVRAATTGVHRDRAVLVFDAAPRFGTPPEPALVRADLLRSLAGALPLDASLAARERSYARPAPASPPPRVLWYDDAATDATVLELRAADRLGLLHRVTAALEETGCDIRAARIATLGSEVVDAFYLRGAAGQPGVTREHRPRVERAVLDAAGPGGERG